MDGQELALTGKFDAVFSNAALHWMAANPPNVIRGVKRVLTPGGRFVAEFGGHGNIALILSSLKTTLHRRGVDFNSTCPW